MFGAGGGRSHRLVAAIVSLYLVAAPLLPLVPPIIYSQHCTCTMACCRLQSQASGKSCAYCQHAPAPMGIAPVNCTCLLTSHDAALAPLPAGVLVPAPVLTQSLIPRSYDALVSVADASGFVRSVFRPPNVVMV